MRFLFWRFFCQDSCALESLMGSLSARRRVKSEESLRPVYTAFLIYIAFAITMKVNKLNQIEPKHLLILAAYSLALGVIVGGGLHHDVPARLLRFVHLTQKTTNYSVWNDTFRHYGGYVQVQLKDGRSVLGWLEFFSDRDDQKSLFLSDAAWVSAEGEAIPVDGPGILLTADSGIEAILFLRHEEHPDV